MRHISTGLIVAGIPLYVLFAFVADVFAPTNVPDSPPEETLRISFVGDMMFDRYVRAKATKHGYDAVMRNTAPLFEETTILIGNLEGPITDFPPVSDWKDTGPNHYRFTFATTVAETLHNTGFSAVSLANNHILNFGDVGFEQTKHWLTEHKVGYFGGHDTLYEPWRYASGSVSVAVFAFDPWYARDAEELSHRISLESDNSFVVVYAHWGDEYEPTPNGGQKELAKQFVDAGADVVVGSHPHVVQTKEEYKGKWVYYSLGNFVFDQYFNDAVQCGAVITLTVEKDGRYDVAERFITLARDGTTEIGSCMEHVPLEK